MKVYIYRLQTSFCYYFVTKCFLQYKYFWGVSRISETKMKEANLSKQSDLNNFGKKFVTFTRIKSRDFRSRSANSGNRGIRIAEKKKS